MQQEDPFADIRPYRDSEVRTVLDRLTAHPELLAAIARLRFPRVPRFLGPLVQPLTGWYLRRQLAGVNDVDSFQQVVENYMRRMIETTTSGFTASGLAALDPGKPCLFISNHRDIALDSAFVNFALYSSGRDTVRIAIGDNLLTKDYASDLMRLNKSFIVKRSVKGPRQMLAVYRELSAYIRHSLLVEKQSIWIAQREGRAKDGWDKTEPAIIKMICMNLEKGGDLGTYIEQLNLVPVAISFEWDPCDAAKARELYLRSAQGSYEKGEQEDVASIATSIKGNKGAVHVSFGTPLSREFNSPEAVAREIDRQILGMYKLQPTNICAYRQLRGELPRGVTESAAVTASTASFQQRLAAMPAAHRDCAIAMYANPVINRPLADSASSA